MPKHPGLFHARLWRWGVPGALHGLPHDGTPDQRAAGVRPSSVAISASRSSKGSLFFSAGGVCVAMSAAALASRAFSSAALASARAASSASASRACQLELTDKVGLKAEIGSGEDGRRAGGTNGVGPHFAHRRMGRRRAGGLAVGVIPARMMGEKRAGPIRGALRSATGAGGATGTTGGAFASSDVPSASPRELSSRFARSPI